MLSLKKAVGEFADDFGYDLDESGQPVEAGDSDRVQSRSDEAAEDEGEARDTAEEAAVA